MAEKHITKSKMTIEVIIGKDSEGKEILEALAFTRISESATDENVAAAGAVIAELQQYPVKCVYRVDESLLGAQA